MTTSLDARRRWMALWVLCLGTLMIVLDTTVVNVALPSIRADLHFSETGLVWVVNAYMLTFGGFLLLGGRLGDLFGQRRMFLAGIALFTVASLACGTAQSQFMLVAARAVQGLGGAVVSAVAMALIMNLFTEENERAKAMGVYGFVCAAGGTVGVVLGGLLTTINWHWIFLVNLPIGVLVYVMAMRLLAPAPGHAQDEPLDVTGAVLITSALMLAVYAIVNGNEIGWRATQTLAMLGAAVGLFIAFVVLEARVRHPLMPLSLFKSRNVVATNLIGVLWSAGMFSWFFISALYMQLVLKYTPLQVGLAFVPADLIMAIFSLGLSAKLVGRFGCRIPLSVGLALGAAGLLCFYWAPVGGDYVRHVLPGMVLLGLGSGIAFNPLLLAAMRDVAPSESGLASGVVNTAFMMGGALGLAVLASLAAAVTQNATATGAQADVALNTGYQIAMLAGAGFAALGALLGALWVRDSAPVAGEAAPMAHG